MNEEIYQSIFNAGHIDNVLQEALRKSVVTQTEYDRLVERGEVIANKFYMVYADGVLMRIYVGHTPIASRDSSAQSVVGSSHSHDNKRLLDSLVELDATNHLITLRELSGQMVRQKVAAGEADHAADSVQWDGHDFIDYIDQALKRSSVVEHEGVKAKTFQSPSFTPGFSGSGFKFHLDPDGNAVGELDELTVRKTMKVYELVIQQMKHQGGIVVWSAASMELTSVESVTGGYKCYFDTKDGQIPNEFSVGDQAMCRRFELGTTVAKYYWRLVTSVGDDYVVLSGTDCDAGSGVPAAGDILVQLGHRTDAARQSAKITTVIGADSPRDEYYQGISSYSLQGKLITVVGKNNGQVGIFTEAGRFSGNVQIGAGSSGLENLSEWAQKETRIVNVENKAEAARLKLKTLLDTINDDAVLDLAEKRALRLEWTAINGIESTGSGSRKGSYYQVKYELQSAGLTFGGTRISYNGRTVLYNGGKVLYKLIGEAALDASYMELRAYLASIGLSDTKNVTYGFDRARLAELLTHYYDCEAQVRDAISKNIDRKVDDTRQELLAQLEDYQAAVERSLAGLQGQLDNSISTWFHAGVPTLTNYPVVGDPEGNWDTNAKKDTHIGDTYYDTNSGVAYHFLKEDGTYKWKAIPDSTVTAALAMASTAKDTADEKRRTFLSVPTTADAYDPGDIWIHATAGSYTDETLVCRTAKAKGVAFSISHWEKASKYTDDTVANQARNEAQAAANAAAAAHTEATSAAAAATAAQNAANTLSGKLDTWASDAYINPAEKTALKQQLKNIQKEYEETCYEAARYQAYITGYDTKISAYTAAYNAAVTAFNKYTAATPENIEVGQDYGNIAAYYDARATFAMSIALGAKARADEAAAAAAAAQSTADTANAKADTGLLLLGVIDDDSNLRLDEKAAIRTEWVSINGVESTGETGEGSYSVTLALARKVSRNNKRISYNGRTVLYHGNRILYNVTGISSLQAAYMELREYLASIGLNDRSGMTKNFDRDELDVRLRNYYTAESRVFYHSDNENRELAAQLDETLQKYSSDGYISPTEKRALLNLLEEENQKKTELFSKAAAYLENAAVLDTKATYSTAVTNMAAVINFYCAAATWGENVAISSAHPLDNISEAFRARTAFESAIAAAIDGRIDSSESTVSAISQELDKISDDGYISPAEKRALQTLLDEEVSLQAGLNQRAQPYQDVTQVTNAKTAYTSAVNEMASVINHYCDSSTWSESIKITTGFPLNKITAAATARANLELAISVAMRNEADDSPAVADALDAIAYKLGFADWQQMKTYARLGDTIISGGYINTSLIDTETLATNNALIQTLWNQQAFINRLEAVEATVQKLTVGKLDTLPSDTKSKIQAEGNQIVMLDANGKKKFRVFDGYIGVYDDLRLTKDLNYLSSPLSLTRSISSYVAQSGTPKYLADELVGFLNMGWCDKGSTLQINSIKVQLTVPYDTNGRSINYYSNAPSYRVTLYNSDGSAVQSWTCSPGSPTYGSSGTTITATLSLNTTITISEDSSYTLRVSIYRNPGPVVQTSPVYWTSPYGSANVNLSYNTSFYIKLTRSNYEYTHIGRDGLMQVFGDGYLFSDGTDFVVKRGVYMLRLKSYTGIQKSTNGGQTWTPL